MPFLELSDIRERQPVPGFRVRFVHSDNMTIAYWEIEAGASMPEHSHLHEQIVSLVEGEFELSVGDEMKTLVPGRVAIVPPDIPHSGRAVTACRITDVFYPVREDYK
ncbi:MAG: cupin domain-containing protein [Candidatus Eisenbacteria bacterium]